jgi:NADH dehydrogenase (ubiquinone) Fe-S protein 2
VLRLLGEKIIAIDAHIGLLHRGTEKLIESKTYLQSLPYFDRLDYVSMMSQEHTFTLAIEKLANIHISRRAKYIRVLFLELTRILNHLMALTAHIMDIGATTPFLWAFEEREKLMEFYERLSGARMHANYIRPGGVAVDLPIGLLNDIYSFICQFYSRIDEIEELLTTNRIWKQRLINIGVVSSKCAVENSITGIMLRSTGVSWDLRVITPYEIYNELLFAIPIGQLGDNYDRYILRLNEMRESCKIVLQCTNNFTMLDSIKIFNDKFVAPLKSEIRTSMEALINHFLYYGEGFNIPENMTYTATESPKGEFGVFLVADGTNKPYRCKIRSPGYFHLQGLADLLRPENSIADLVSVIGSIDIVFGEIDR